ncbi:MAG TPA: FecR domain-containing protein [Puia sp.]|nr:FecR domain-containing protein [Puia sp.]
MSKEFHEPEDFLSDESFLSWYFEAGEAGSWESWMAGAPGRRELVDRAIAILDATRMREKPLPAGQMQRAEAALMGRIDELINIGAEPAEPRILAGRHRPLRARGRWMAAAAVLVLVGVGLVVYRMLPVRQSQLASGYGEQLSQQLPDGSEVTMNANSRLHYFNKWQDGVDREVWIEGEAFFHVRKTPMKSRFIVHTDEFDVVVTGTQFNVVNRNGRDNVLLQEGSVIIHPKTGEDLHMVPGDFVQWDGNRLKRSTVRLDSLTAWRDHQIVFDKTPLREVAAIIEEQYGVKVNLVAPSIGDSLISGILPNNNLNVLLQALETTSDFDVTRDGGNITIKASAH